MITWVMYDISETRTRNKIVKECENKGLYRVQKSVFIGELSKSEVSCISDYINDIVDKNTDSVYVFPMNKQELQQAKLIGQAFNKELVSGELISKFF